MFVLPDFGGGTEESNIEAAQAQSKQYANQAEALKAQLEAEGKKQANEQAAWDEAERQRKETEALQKQLDDLKRKEKTRRPKAMVEPSLSVGGTKVGEMVHVSDYGFYIDKYEVTNAQYAVFVESTSHRGPESEGYGKGPWNTWSGDRPPSGYEDHPVSVTWFGAKAYCEWAEKRLPTQEEWHQACQGTSRLKYPWGNSFGTGNANIDGIGDGYVKTAPVGSFPSGASPYGAMDMSGNVWEHSSTQVGSKNHVMLGGSRNRSAEHSKCRVLSNHPQDLWAASIGFRCAR